MVFWYDILDINLRKMGIIRLKYHIRKENKKMMFFYE